MICQLFNYPPVLSKLASMHGGLGNVSMVDGFIFLYRSPPLICTPLQGNWFSLLPPGCAVNLHYCLSDIDSTARFLHYWNCFYPLMEVTILILINRLYDPCCDVYGVIHGIWSSLNWKSWCLRKLKWLEMVTQSAWFCR